MFYPQITLWILLISPLIEQGCRCRWASSDLTAHGCLDWERALGVAHCHCQQVFHQFSIFQVKLTYEDRCLALVF